MKLDITEQERRVLLHVIKMALDDPRSPLSPEIETLRAIWAKLERGRKSKPTAMSSAHE
jgi:hypothetical protein